jgi:glycerol-3-phosphate dehydrogenase
MLRLGLFVYDHLGGRRLLPPARSLDLRRDPAGAPLRAEYRRGFEYSDCWVDDARLVVLNARDAAERGAAIRPRTRFETAARADGLWTATLRDMATGETSVVRARAIVNAGGPWVDDVLRGRIRMNGGDHIRLVRGSHIVVPRLFEHDRAYIFQQSDGRVVFAIPYEGDFTLIGTTDAEHEGPPEDAECTPEEAAYLCAAVSEYFRRTVHPDDIVWTYSGVRPLFDDGAKSATAATRDYVLDFEAPEGEPPLLNVYGGKITTYRRLSELALDKLAPGFPRLGPAWTGAAPLPGGDFPVDGVAACIADLRQRYGFLDEAWARRLVRAYGTRAGGMLGDARSAADLGRDFGATLTEREVDWLMRTEWARTAEDVLWRRSKLGLHLDEGQAAALADWMALRTAA